MNETRFNSEYTERCRDYFKTEYPQGATFFIQNEGCQMNSLQTETVAGMALQMGLTETTEEQNASVVIYNTCTVRENANQKIYGHLGGLKSIKRKNPGLKIVLFGCMMQEHHVIEKIRKDYPFVDVVFGTHNIHKFPELFYRSLMGNSQIIDIWEDSDEIVEGLPTARKYSFKTGVNIMFGCNNFCSYCIVPYVRGREKSREPVSILRELETLAAQGVSEVMLLGQNVNSYGKTLDIPVSFAELLKE
ncbi:MAG TPA: tRNA (N6-isopentenyl adenosine(37)-C2)-methylthiotransferase MiaB, partial [Lachnospiraceae bacterium]|nr:tRNA (N6-isopentenyl adenosine(37)-C2)-methylthiotransferase MiaB [Lachnospiraceae bacterium]